MKAKQPFFYKDGPVKYVRRIKAAYTLFSALFIVAFMVLLVFAFNGSDVGKPVFFSVAAVLLIGYFISYGFYTSRVTLGTVLGIETTDLVVHLHTPRKTYTYDVRMAAWGSASTKTALWRCSRRRTRATASSSTSTRPSPRTRTGSLPSPISPVLPPVLPKYPNNIHLCKNICI